MKKILAVISVILLLLALCSCKGNGRNAVVVPVKSDVYTVEDIDTAVKTVMDYFESGFSGCTLKEIKYIGDEESESFIGLAKQYNADEAIILVSTFDVDFTGGDGSLTPNSTYTNWTWILVRDEGGSWRHVSHGYG